MDKVETTVRKAPFILRASILMSWLFVFTLFMINPTLQSSTENEHGFKMMMFISLCLSVFLSYLYFRLPKVSVVLMKLEDRDLSFTSMQNPAFGMGEDYQDNFIVDIDDVLYVYPYIMYIHKVGSFFCITFYCKEAGVIPVFYETEYETNLVKLLKKILDKNNNIKIINVHDYAKAYFPHLVSRMISEIPDNYHPANMYKRDPFSGKFSEKDWQTLLLCPLCVFVNVAKADGNVDKRESRSLISLLKSANEYKSFLVTDLLNSINENFDSLLDIVISDDSIHLDNILHDAVILVDKVGDEIDKESFGHMLVNFGQSVAEASCPGDQRISSQEQLVLDKIKFILGIGK